MIIHWLKNQFLHWCQVFTLSYLYFVMHGVNHLVQVIYQIISTMTTNSDIRMFDISKMHLSNSQSIKKQKKNVFTLFMKQTFLFEITGVLYECTVFWSVICQQLSVTSSITLIFWKCLPFPLLVSPRLAENSRHWKEWLFLNGLIASQKTKTFKHRFNQMFIIFTICISPKQYL